MVTIMSFDCTHYISPFASELLPILSSHFHGMAERVRPKRTDENSGRRHIEAWLGFLHALLRAIQVRFHVTKYYARHFP